MILETTQITKKYTSSSHQITALSTTNLKLQAGQLTVITGRSGSGKTTLLHILAGLLQPSSGYVELDNKDIYNMTDKEQAYFRNKNIAVIPQGTAAIASLTVLENVLLVGSLYGKEDRQYAMQLLKELALASLVDMLPAELSGGELKRVSIARALYQNVQVILADEPTADLDAENSAQVISLLRQEADKGKLVLVVTHDPAMLPAADVHYVMDAGNLSPA